YLRVGLSLLSVQDRLRLHRLLPLLLHLGLRRPSALGLRRRQLVLLGPAEGGRGLRLLPRLGLDVGGQGPPPGAPSPPPPARSVVASASAAAVPV
ncbi:hypothetical protein, partial [Streptomyces solaniscabiei]|uniref:hypothetical protein n=1 Tax=Streptomyces solaniscabiei TaxID=2683255 RepID=UPI001CE378A9